MLAGLSSKFRLNRYLAFVIVEVLAVVLVLTTDADMRVAKDEFIAGAFYFETSGYYTP